MLLQKGFIMGRFKGVPKHLVITRPSATPEELAAKFYQGHQAKNKGPTKKGKKERTASKHKNRRYEND